MLVESINRLWGRIELPAKQMPDQNLCAKRKPQSGFPLDNLRILQAFSKHKRIKKICFPLLTFEDSNITYLIIRYKHIKLNQGSYVSLLNQLQKLF